MNVVESLRQQLTRKDYQARHNDRDDHGDDDATDVGDDHYKWLALGVGEFIPKTGESPQSK